MSEYLGPDFSFAQGVGRLGGDAFQEAQRSRPEGMSGGVTPNTESTGQPFGFSTKAHQAAPPAPSPGELLTRRITAAAHAQPHHHTPDAMSAPIEAIAAQDPGEIAAPAAGGQAIPEAPRLFAVGPAHEAGTQDAPKAIEAPIQEVPSTTVKPVTIQPARSRRLAAVKEPVISPQEAFRQSIVTMRSNLLETLKTPVAPIVTGELFATKTNPLKPKSTELVATGKSGQISPRDLYPEELRESLDTLPRFTRGDLRRGITSRFKLQQETAGSGTDEDAVTAKQTADESVTAKTTVKVATEAAAEDTTKPPAAAVAEHSTQGHTEVPQKASVDVQAKPTTPVDPLQGSGRRRLPYDPSNDAPIDPVSHATFPANSQLFDIATTPAAEAPFTVLAKGGNLNDLLSQTAHSTTEAQAAAPAPTLEPSDPFGVMNSADAVHEGVIGGLPTNSLLLTPALDKAPEARGGAEWIARVNAERDGSTTGDGAANLNNLDATGLARVYQIHGRTGQRELPRGVVVGNLALNAGDSLGGESQDYPRRGSHEQASDSDADASNRADTEQPAHESTTSTSGAGTVSETSGAGDPAIGEIGRAVADELKKGVGRLALKFGRWALGNNSDKS